MLGFHDFWIRRFFGNIWSMENISGKWFPSCLFQGDERFESDKFQQLKKDFKRRETFSSANPRRKPEGHPAPFETGKNHFFIKEEI